MWEKDFEAYESHDSRDLRTALGSFPTGVCLITTNDSRGKPVGLTANSFSSVSLTPPMVLWSLGRTSNSAAAFRNSEHFVINVLAEEDQAISNHFAKSGVDKFEAFPGRFEAGLHDMPCLKGAVARFECHTRHRYYGGDHVIVVGLVERYSHLPAKPLAFLRGKYIPL